MEMMDRNRFRAPVDDVDPHETREWQEAFDAVLAAHGKERGRFLLSQLIQQGWAKGVPLAPQMTTPYVNTIEPKDQPPYPGDRRIERRIKSILRWNAMALVVNSNKRFPGLGGHISTYASSATLLEVGFNHFFRGAQDDFPGDLVYFQGHGSPGIYARAYLEYRLDAAHLHNFRRELAEGGGLSSYPHPRLMPRFWQFPTVSMGLGPICALYQARYVRYLRNRGLISGQEPRIWAFLGDGEMDEPESQGALTLAAREGLDNIIFVVNCNLQRLDGPVRGNGKVIQELEANFRGAGWNVIKVLWGNDWDPLFEADKDGLLRRRLLEMVDGEYQKVVVQPGSWIRDHVFGKYESTRKLVEHLTDDQVRTLRRGGHDPAKVHAAYRAAVETGGQPTVILANTIKGYGLGEAGEGRNITHQQKKLNEEELKAFRDRFEIPISDAELSQALPFFRPDKRSIEYEYLMERRRRLGGFLPMRRPPRSPRIESPKLETLKELTGGTGATREVSTTMAGVRLLTLLIKNPEIGKLVVPIVPDEARTFGMDSLFRECGIYASQGQLYEPVDSHVLLYYKESRDGQILEEGITEAGSLSSFIAAGSAYSTLDINSIPFFFFYSMFGFQRVGDFIWQASDQKCKGFLMGATAGRTTLNGEGLQHQDGHSQVLASTIPNLKVYDPAFAYELAVIVQDGIRRMYEEREDIFYYITIYNENYVMPPMPKDAPAGIIKGLYKISAAEKPGKKEPRIHLFGSGPVLNKAIQAAAVLREKYGVAADVWSATSYKELRSDAMECERWNRLHPEQTPKKPYVTQVLENEPWPVVAVTDYMKIVPEQIARWVPGGLTPLGTDGFGRSETRESLRRFFEVDTECVTLAALYELHKRGEIEKSVVTQAIKDLGIDPEKPNPVDFWPKED